MHFQNFPRKSIDMTQLVIQGEATRFDVPIAHGDKIIILKSGCFDECLKSGTKIDLLMDHDSTKSFGSTENRLLLYAGQKSLAFRFLIPERHSKEYAEVGDDLDYFLAVSIGYKNAKTEASVVDGVNVVSVISADLEEVSLLDKPGAVKTTFARVVDIETCGLLADDSDSGMFELYGTYYSLRRAAKAAGVDVSESAYDKAATRFEKALMRLG
jgi:HK97 family phage prohead protease